MAKKNNKAGDEDETRLAEYLRALSGLSRISSELLEEERLLLHVCGVVSGVTHIKHVKVMKYRPDDGDLLLVAGVGWKEGIVGTVTFPLTPDDPAGRAMQTGMPVFVEDIRADKDYRESPVLAEHGIVSLHNVPVRIDGSIWGVLEVDAEEPRSFADNDLTFLTSVAHILGTSLARLRAEAKAASLAAEYARKRQFHDVMLREFKHRVKNNLQTIIAFLSLQKGKSPSQGDARLLTTIMNRVHAIALAQDQLSLDDDIREVEFADYLHALCSNIDPHQDRISVELDVRGDITLPLDRAVPIGLIVNELVTNAFKYAFDEQGGIIRVTFRIAPEIAEGHLIVQDNGRGLGEPRDGSLGLHLVKMLTTQIEGKFSHEPADRGTRFCLRFPLPV